MMSTPGNVTITDSGLSKIPLKEKKKEKNNFYP